MLAKPNNAKKSASTIGKSLLSAVLLRKFTNTNITALKQTYQLRGMAITLSMSRTISPRQWQPWTAVSPLLGLISMA